MGYNQLKHDASPEATEPLKSKYPRIIPKLQYDRAGGTSLWLVAMLAVALTLWAARAAAPLFAGTHRQRTRHSCPSSGGRNRWPRRS